AGDDRPPLRVDHLRRRAALPQHLILGPGSNDLPFIDRDGVDESRDAVGGDFRIVENDIGRHAGLRSVWIVAASGEHLVAAGAYLCAFAASGTRYAGSSVAGAPCTIVYAYSTPTPYAP